MAKKRASREKRTLIYPSDMQSPREWLRFVQMSIFEEAWTAWELEDDDLRALEMLVLINPDGYPVIPGTGGVRKVRFAAKHWPHGKSKGARVYYLYVPEKGIVVWLFAHMRDEPDLLTYQGKASIKKVVEQIVELFDGGT